MTIKTRADLKAYFVKNAIPTEGNFADLIDSQLNQAQDGVFRRQGEPLSVTAAGGTQQRVLHLYADGSARQPDWMFSLNPAQDPGEPVATSKPGFGITEGNGRTSLFVAKGSGHVGVGTNAPTAALDVDGEAVAKTLTITGAIVPSVGNGENRGIQFPKDPGGGGGDRAFIRYYAASGEATKLVIGINNDADDVIALHQMGQDRLTIHSGNVGINKANPTAALDVSGSAKVSRRLTVDGGIVFSADAPGHINEDGALYRHKAAVFMSIAGTINFRRFDGTVAAKIDTSNGDLSLRGKVRQMSDARLKHDVQPIRDPLDSILALRGITYHRRDLESSPRHIGLIAQEVEEVFPEVVGVDEAGNRSVAYSELVAPLIEAVKALRAEVVALRAEVDALSSGPQGGVSS